MAAPAAAAAAAGVAPGAGAGAGAASTNENSVRGWLTESGDEAASAEHVLLAGLTSELAKANGGEVNAAVLASYIQELGMRLGVQVPIQVVIGAEKAGKSRYVEFLLGCLPIGFSHSLRATRQPIVYMIRHRATLDTEYKCKIKPTPTVNIRAAMPALPPANSQGWIEVDILKLAATIKACQEQIGNQGPNMSGLSEEWMIVSIETKDPTIKPIIVVDCPGLVNQPLDGVQDNKIRLQRISSALLSAHKNFFRAVIVIRAADGPASFAMFGSNDGDFDVGKYDKIDGRPQGHISVLLNYATTVVAEAKRDYAVNPQKRVLEILDEWRKNVEPRTRRPCIPICFADMHHFADGYGDIRDMDAFNQWRVKIKANLDAKSAELLAFLPRDSPINPWPEKVEMDLDRFQQEEQARFIQLVKDSYNTVANNFQAKLKAAKEALRGINKLWEQSPQPDETLDRMSVLANRLRAVITDDLWPARRFTGDPGTSAAIDAVYDKYSVDCALSSQAGNPKAASLAVEAWPDRTDNDFISLCMAEAAAGGHTNFSLQWERILAEMRARGVAHVIEKKRQADTNRQPFPSNKELLDVAPVDSAGALNLNLAVFRLVCDGLDDSSITAGIRYRLVRLHLFMSQMFAMAFDLLQANHETPSKSPEFRTQVLRRIDALITRWVDEYLKRKLFDTQQMMRDGAFRSYTLNLVLNAPTFIGFAIPATPHVPAAPAAAAVPPVAGVGAIPPPPAVPFVVSDSTIDTQMKYMAKLALGNAALQVSVTDYVSPTDEAYDNARKLYKYLWNHAKFQIAMDLEKEMRIYPHAFLYSGRRCRADEIFPFLTGDIDAYEETRHGAVHDNGMDGDDDEKQQPARAAGNGVHVNGQQGPAAAQNGRGPRAPQARPGAPAAAGARGRRSAAGSGLYYDKSMFRPLPDQIPYRTLFESFAFNTNHEALKNSLKTNEEHMRNLQEVVDTLEATRLVLFNLQP